jgi:hypothetical protein
MKISKFLFVFLLLLSVISFQSCENEALDSGIISNVDNQDDGNNEGNDGGNEGNGNNEGTGEESTGDYWPRAIGNMWNFNDTFYGEVNYNMIATEQIDGNTYFKFDDLFNQEAWLRKSGDSYFIRNAVNGFPIEGYEVSTTFITIKMLEDTANVGDQWSTNVSYTISYTPINPAFPEIPNIDFSASTVDYFYAKDVGLIEFIGDQSSGTLLNYSLN